MHSKVENLFRSLSIPARIIWHNQLVSVNTKLIHKPVHLPFYFNPTKQLIFKALVSRCSNPKLYMVEVYPSL